MGCTGFCDGCYASCKLFYQRSLSKGVIPLWRSSIIWVGANFGSGIAVRPSLEAQPPVSHADPARTSQGFFAQWRSPVIIDLLIFVLWIPLIYLHWFNAKGDRVRE